MKATRQVNRTGKRPPRAYRIAGDHYPADLREAVQQFEMQFLLGCLQKNNGNISRTAEEIGMTRRSLQLKIKLYGIAKPNHFSPNSAITHSSVESELLLGNDV